MSRWKALVGIAVVITAGVATSTLRDENPHSVPTGQSASIDSAHEPSAVERPKTIAADASSKHRLVSSPGLLPPAGLPLRNTLDSLLRLAKAGDAEAASRLAKEAVNCTEYRYTLQTVDSLAQPASEDLSPITDEHSAALAEEQIDHARRNIARASRLGALCEGIGDEILDGRVFAYAEIAATLGDWKAGNCVVEGVLMPGNAPLDSDLWEEYRAAAPVIARHQLEAGDVTMVAQLIDVYDPPPGSLYQQLNLADKRKSFLYAMLLAHIADDESLFDINSRIEYAAKELSGAEIDEATNEAARLYAQYFPHAKRRIDFRRSEAVCHPGYL